MNSVKKPRGLLAKGKAVRAVTRVLSISPIWLAILLLAWLLGFSAASRAAQLTIADGVVVKFGWGAGLVVRDALRTGRDVVFTSLSDDDLGGPSGLVATTPAAGDWAGVVLDQAALPDTVHIDGLDLRYAGGAGVAALSFQQHDYSFSELRVYDSLIGIRATTGGSAHLTDTTLIDNDIGLQAQGGATPIISGSDLHHNSQFAVENQNPTTPVLAIGNWWGAANGPSDPVGNPAGQGDRVSAGVDYGQFRSSPPLLNCTITPRDGYYTP